MANRLLFLAAVTAGLASASSPSGLAPASSPSEFASLVSTLRAEASKHGIFFGAATNAGLISQSNQTDEELYSDLDGSEFDLVTAENGCKWDATEPEQGTFTLDRCDAVAQFAADNDQTFRGHNLCWGNQNPNWLTSGDFNASGLESALTSHIDTMISHYNTTACCWDVVNEAIADSGDDVYKPTVWYPTLASYVKVAFSAAEKARAALPQPKQAAAAASSSAPLLFYNDYNVASSSGWSATKSDRMYEMVKDLKSAGVAVDGVGFQTHLEIDYSMVAGIKANLARYEALGVEVHMTEVDVGCVQTTKTCPEWGETQEKKQAEVYAALLAACLDSPACTSFETWGLTDLHTWRTTQNHPLPFDENYAPKEAVTAMLATMQGDRRYVDAYYSRIARLEALYESAGLGKEALHNIDHAGYLQGKEAWQQESTASQARSLAATATAIAAAAPAASTAAEVATDDDTTYYKLVTVAGTPGCVQADVSATTAKAFGGKAGTCPAQGFTVPTGSQKIPFCCTVQGFKKP